MFVWIKLIWGNIDLLVEGQGCPFSLWQRKRYSALSNFSIRFHCEHKMLTRTCSDINMGAGLNILIYQTLIIRNQEIYLFIKISWVDNSPVGHGQSIAWTFGHLHSACCHDERLLTKLILKDQFSMNW